MSDSKGHFLILIIIFVPKACDLQCNMHVISVHDLRVISLLRRIHTSDCVISYEANFWEDVMK